MRSMSRGALQARPPRLSLYCALVTARLALTLAPQRGYIHPDEYFQNMEVIAGDVFSIDTSRVWEFNSTFPLRNIFIPKITFGLPYHTIRLLSPYVQYYFGVDLRSPYFLLVIPRLLFFCLSLINDFCLYKICTIYGQNYQNRLVILASSHVILVFSCRSLSNSFEMVLFSVLLLLVAECMRKSDRIIYHEEFLQDKYRRANSVVERVKLYKLKTHLPSHSLSRVVSISTVSAVGFFNRATFLGFAFPALFMWLQRGLGSKVVTFKDFHYRIITLGVCAIPTVLILVIVDSSYYGHLTIAEIESFKLSMNNFVITPFNFLLYNTRTENLAKHGIHPFYLHFLVNVPLLFNVLGIMGLMAVALNFYRFILGRYSKLPKIQSITGLMLFSFFTPVALLSLFPHQELRFIIPVLVPLVYLHGNYLFSTTDDSITVKKFKNVLLAIWYITNIILTIFFGFIHQGGVYPLVNRLNDDIKVNRANGLQTHVVTSHSYSLPTSLFQIEITSKVWFNKATSHNYKLLPHVLFYEYGSLSLDKLFERMHRIMDNAETLGKPYKIYLAAPCSLEVSILDISLNFTSLNVQQEASFYPHVSTESLPSLPDNSDRLCFNKDSDVESRSVKLNLVQRVQCLFTRFCMKLYSVGKTGNLVLNGTTL